MSLQNARLFYNMVGICVGFLIYMLINVGQLAELDQSITQFDDAVDFQPNVDQLSYNLTLRCVILVRPDDMRPQKYMQSIVDTYASLCNKTLFFTNTTKYQRSVHGLEILLKRDQHLGKYDIYSVNDFGDITEYYVFYRIARFVQNLKEEFNWTIFLNEQNYVFVNNLRSAIGNIPSDSIHIFGRVFAYKPLFAYIFPFLSIDAFIAESGILFSREALRMLTTSSDCEPQFFMPRHTGRALFKCSKAINAHIGATSQLDPGGQSFISDNLRNLFTTGFHINQCGTVGGSCIEKPLTLSNVNHRDLRVIDFVLNRIRVFGNNK